MAISRLGQALLAAMRRPDDWEHVNEYKILHIPSNTVWWTANGEFFFDLQSEHALGYIERHYLWWAGARPLLRELKRRSLPK